jgi:electron transport complex protein RnfD
MLNVLVALIPAGAVGVYFFGWRSLAVIAVSVLSAVAWEWLYCKLAKKPSTVSDLSAAVTGLLLAYNLPASVPLWLPIVGNGIAIILVKQFFGGIGHNFVNPALTARCVLMSSWAGLMSADAYHVAVRGLDAVSAATHLSSVTPSFTLWQLFIGQSTGCIGEVSKIALLLGGVYLIARGIISWRIPATMLATVFALSWIASGRLTGSTDSALYQLLSGALFISAFFMATDYATSPVTPLGRIVMGVGCGALVFVLRRFSPMPEGCSYAILMMNLCVPLIDRFTRPRVYGEVKNRA